MQYSIVLLPRCPKSWMNNIYITRLMELSSTSNTCSGIGKHIHSGTELTLAESTGCYRLSFYCACFIHTTGSTGFSGLKGCIGAEFHIHGTPPRALTKKECESTQLGLSDMEAAIFMSDDGGSLWCGCNVQLPSRDSFCGGDEVS